MIGTVQSMILAGKREYPNASLILANLYMASSKSYEPFYVMLVKGMNE